MSDEALAARMEAEHYARLRERELLLARESLSIKAQEDEEDLEAERCECGVVSRGLVEGRCADCRERSGGPGA